MIRAGLAVVFLGFGVVAHAGDFLVDSSGQQVKNGFGDCWITGYAEQKDSTCSPEKEAFVPAKPARPQVSTAVAKAPAVKPWQERLVLHFEFDKISLSASDKLALTKLAKTLETNAGVEAILIVGHTDSTGSRGYNERLGLRRAASVWEYLRTMGVSGSKVTISSHGELAPVASNGTKAGRAQNRRVTVEALGLQ